MPNEFVVLVNGQLKRYERFEDIPQVIDNVIKFIPDVPEPPHTHEQHEEIDAWQDKFKELMARETNGNFNNN